MVMGLLVSSVVHYREFVWKLLYAWNLQTWANNCSEVEDMVITGWLDAFNQCNQSHDSNKDNKGHTLDMKFYLIVH